ncbi:hypothetical protein SERLADRAFT_433063 [Serpula lacrymans var. lacrymans S7.9]|uniref:Uncharacterized protein n=1 Tax=Serpula lacrymans var. lacrymans (strain S7.9) TaxID=578457 RepID=F8NGB5_SERL9|nr:uncharacterized protein SERLADRAFT_433063 [Serpula lacrymans var. lacrymans S7.9]EGO29050.1 hypothetical protein SERLADRAFT_433063 [Serpula lacrymans var. lacrymans S7.9]
MASEPNSHSQLEGPTNERTPNSNIIMLKAAIREIEDLKITHQHFRDITDKRVKVLNAENILLKQDNQQIKAEMDNLKKQIVALNKAGGVYCVECEESGGEEENNESDISGDREHMKDVLTSIQISLNNINPVTIALETLTPHQREALSFEAADSKPVKDAINEVFMRKLGVDKLEAKHLPDYLLSIDPSQCPKDTATQKISHCYNWKLSADDKANSKNLVEIQQWVILNATVEIPPIVGMLQLVLPKNLKHQICVKFQYMARQDLSDTQEENLVSMSVSKAHRDSCAQSKLNQQICKQPFSTYTDKKFDAAFILNAMSDDEDNPDYWPMSDEVRTFISRAPDYWSEILGNDDFWKDLSGRGLLLAVITPCKTEGKDAALKVAVYGGLAAAIATDIRNIKAVVGRVKTRGKWGIIDRTSGLASVAFTHQDTEGVEFEFYDSGPGSDDDFMQ